MSTSPSPEGTSSSPVGSVDKALVLLQVLAEAGPDGLMLREIAEASGFHKASSHRILQALVHRGFALQDPSDQRYRLGSAPMMLAEQYAREDRLPALFSPALAGISHASRELVHLGTMDGTSVLYLDKVEPERTLRVWSRVGHRAPAARTALGRAMLAALDVSGFALAPYADATTADAGPSVPLPHLQEVVGRARERGWSAEVEENEQGIACVGVGLLRFDGRAAAVSVTGPAERMDEERREQLGELLRSELERLGPSGFRVAARD
ncbi:IclR family transcriptional regulator [Brachybacterium endophyticum]|uniref:IclR family transcriptional regulator n=1 Tax=Brachybacterium endophyticum TaxID=2182385 RepID=A0A2U2RMY9_9MICO|nr:IclR family transcriptional regulator [Brachybacterium endophyticum]PWH07239.1 IclR family transcriptional regulator [Brachybacterium endophyticum]